MTITWVGAHSNNYAKGREGNTIKKIVIHWIVGKLEAADAVFKNSGSIVSAHYGIGGTVVHQYVKEEDTAYHAGNLTVNRQSVGIEHEGGPDLPISDLTYKISSQLIADICRRYSIPLDRTHIIKHSEVKATQCPGTLDLDKLIGMATQIVAPSNLQEELNTIRKECNDNHDDRMSLYSELGFEGKFNRITAVTEIQQLKEIAKKSGEKDEELKALREELKTVREELQATKEKITELQKAAQDTQVATDVVSSQIDNTIEKTKNIEKKVDASIKDDESIWWESLVAWIKNIFRK